MKQESIFCYLDKSPLEQAFEKFHAEHPEVMVLILQFARQAKAAGRQRFGIGMIWERMRWYTQIEHRECEFKLNNNHRAYYARKIMRDYPDEFAGFFEIRGGD